MTEQQTKEKLGRCMAEDWENFNIGTRNAHRRITRCRAAATARITNDVFGNSSVCLCEKHLATYDELKAVRLFHSVYIAPVLNDHRDWVMKPVVGAAVRYVRGSDSTVEVVEPNERSHHNRREWLEATEDELSLWEQILAERERAIKAHREQEQELFERLAKVAQKVSDMREARKKEVQ